MTSNERVAKVIVHEPPDRVAIDYYARSEVTLNLKKRFGLKETDSIEEFLGVDLYFTGPEIKKKADVLCYADPTVEVTPDGIYKDVWGVGFKPNSTSSGFYMDLAYSPLRNVTSLKEIENYNWPSPDIWDYRNIGSGSNGEIFSRYWVWAHSRGIFEISWFMRGFNEFMMDMIENPERANLIMDNVQKYLMERSRRILEAGNGRIDMIEYNDDVGGQNGMLISPKLWRRFIKPRMASFIKLCKGYGVKVRFHSCGGIRPIIPDLIEIGVDVLTPVQTLADGMGPEGLKRDFGDSITFNGGIDTQELLVKRDSRSVYAETKRLIEIFGKNGGYILGPSHVFQPDVALDNIIAVYEAVLNKKLEL